MNNTGKKTILYVEDLKDAYDLVEVFLLDSYKVIGAQNKSEALIRLNEDKVDLILMDINLQRPFDGVELAIHIKSVPELKTIPIIALTAYTMENDKRKIIAAGLDEFISKPVSKVVLLNKIGLFLN